MKNFNWAKYENWLYALVGVVLALGVRYPLLGFASGDFHGFTSGWYNYIRTHGFAAFGDGFANYTPAYLYLLYLASLLAPNLEAVQAIKLPASACDLLMAYYVWRIAEIKFGVGSTRAVLCGVAFLFLPTVVLNSAFWGQADAVYTVGLVACLYYLLKRQNVFALIAYSLAFSVKLQAIFFAPLLLILVLQRQLDWKLLFLVPLIYSLTLMPSVITGRKFADLAFIYFDQSTEATKNLNSNIPNLYIWLSNDLPQFFTQAGLALAVTAVLAFVVVVLKSRQAINPPTLTLLAFTSVLLVPFVLPKMNDRYFYPADVLSFIYALFFPKKFYLAAGMSLISFFTYQLFLFEREVIPLNLLALGTLAILLQLSRDLFTTLHPTADVPTS